MNRRDVIIGLLALIWALFVWFILPTMELTSMGLIVCFTCSMAILTMAIILLIVLSFVIKRFGTWGDKKLWHSF